MRRILALILATMMMVCVFVACDGGDEPTPEQPTAPQTTEAPTEAPTTEAPTEAPTEDNGEPELIDVYIDVWEDKTQSAQAIDEKSKGVGIVITIPEGGYLSEAGAPCPSYSDDIGSLTLKVFAWNTDFDTTVAAEPLYSEEFVDFADNSSLLSFFDEGLIGSGTFLILLCEGKDEGEGVGVWMDSPIKDEYLLEEVAKYNIQSWINGKQNKKKIAKFSLVIVEPEA